VYFARLISLTVIRFSDSLVSYGVIYSFSAWDITVKLIFLAFIMAFSIMSSLRTPLPSSDMKLTGWTATGSAI
jgi:hypothetical protein